MLNCSWFQSFVSNPVKRDPILDQFSLITRPYTRPNGSIPFPAAHTHIANIWEYPPPVVTIIMDYYRYFTLNTLALSSLINPCGKSFLLPKLLTRHKTEAVWDANWTRQTFIPLSTLNSASKPSASAVENSWSTCRTHSGDCSWSALLTKWISPSNLIYGSSSRRHCSSGVTTKSRCSRICWVGWSLVLIDLIVLQDDTESLCRWQFRNRNNKLATSFLALWEINLDVLEMKTPKGDILNSYLIEI